ncbi:efflux RND transporter permease subunit [Thalassobacillus sp. CUG 92003]|uniref:efflux RND transporter permease subunit n=1 Tax=Thalassobacillus sp. CUG 92003 TaxID=2736641 RepID=UPI0015E6D8E7|nr:efflux RND transporter permease subunit [Thalassobacillus sp. CUG 92003]
MKRLLHYKKIVWVFVLLFIFTGIFTYLQLPKRDIPEINVNIATISTVYPGAAPSEVESSIVNPIEEQLETIEGISETTSAATTGFSNITVTLEDSVNRNTVNAQIRQVVSDVSQEFPEDAQTPDVNTDLRTSAVSSYHVLGENPAQLYELRERIENWRETLTDINGVEALQVKGLPEEQLTVQLDPEALSDNQVTPSQVIEAINQESSPSAIGTEQQDDRIYQLNFPKYTEITEIEDIPVGQDAENNPVRLGQVGSVSTGIKEAEDLISYEGKPALSLTILAEEGVNITSLQQRISSHVEEWKSELPANISLDRFYTQSTIIEEVFTNLLTSFAISLGAVILIMLLGLPFSSAILVSLAIPISILIGLIPLPYAGVDLNQISIIGIIIAIGILVDDAIVVNDNIQRRYQLGDAPLEGAIKGVKDVRKSILTSTLMIIFSFLPLTFLSGSNGDFIRALPTALIVTITASTIIALTLIPTVQYARRNRKKWKHTEKVGLLGGVFNGIERRYADRTLPFILKKPWVTGGVGLLICCLLALLVIRIPFEFFPSADRPEVTVSIEFPEGYPIEETQSQIESIEAYLANKEERIQETAVYTGGGLPNIFNSSLERSGPNTGQLLVRVNRSAISASTFINKWEEPLREQFSEAEIFMETIVSGPPPSPPVQLKIQGTELNTLTALAKEARDGLAELDATEIATLNAGDAQPAINYEPDRTLLAESNIPVSQVTSLIQLANTGVPLGTFDNGTERLPLQIAIDDEQEDGVNLDALSVTARNGQGGGPPPSFTLDEVITTNESEQTSVIPHLNGKRTLTIEAYPKDERESTFTEETDAFLSDFQQNLPQGYNVVQSGEASAESEFFIEVAKLFVIVLFLIYLTIAIQFNSLTMPLLITSTVFLAITGAIVGLFVFNQPLSFLAVLGIVSLSGIVVRNAVILIEFIEQNRKAYTSTLEAVIEAGRARVRPIILTSLTSIAALTPIIFTGDALFRPLAVSIVSGLLFSTVLTLLMVPAFYLILESIRKRKTVKG